MTVVYKRYKQDSNKTGYRTGFLKYIHKKLPRGQNTLVLYYIYLQNELHF